MSECTNGELRDLLPELVNGRIDAVMREAVEVHIESCTECAEELALLRALRPALLHSPAIDADRIAAAVRAQTAGASSREPTRAGIATRWRIAMAAAALLTVGALGYVANVHRTTGAPTVAVAPVVVPPRSAPVRAPTQQVAVAPSQAPAVPAAAGPLARTGVLENVSDLSDEEVRTLTASIDKLSPIPDAEPAPGIDPLGASLDDLSAGGR